MFKHTLDNFNHAIAIYATDAISSKLKGLQVARIAEVQVASPVKT